MAAGQVRSVDSFGGCLGSRLRLAKKDLSHQAKPQYVCVHMYESMFVHMCMYICACVCMHVCMYVCNCVSMYVLGRRAPFRTHCYTSSAPNSSCPQYRCHQPSIHCANVVQPTRVVIYEILVVERVLLDFIAVQRTVLNTNLAGKMHVPE